MEHDVIFKLDKAVQSCIVNVYRGHSAKGGNYYGTKWCQSDSARMFSNGAIYRINVKVKETTKCGS